MNFLFCDDVVCISILSIFILVYGLSFHSLFISPGIGSPWLELPSSVSEPMQGTGEAARPCDCTGSGDADLDLLGSGFLVLGQMHFEHAVFEVSGDFGGAGVSRERKTAAKAAVSALDPVIFLTVALLFALAVTRDGQ